MPVRLMTAGMKPTEEDIRAEGDRVTQAITRSDLVWDKGRPMNEPEVKAKIAAELASLPDRMKHEAANDCLVYIETDSFDIAAPIQGQGQAPGPPVVYWAQIGLWLQEDLCRAINDANSGAKSVRESTVKRLIKISPQDLFSRQTNMPAPSDGSDGSMMATPADPSQPIEKNYAISPTGRYSNPLYDVVTFRMSAIVDSDRLPIFLQSLSRNRFITIYETNISSVDSGLEQAAGYIYGPEPVVQVDMQGEALFMREWTRQYMPPYVKSMLGVVDEQQPMPGQ
jgi:hypothetical protein